MRQRLPIILSVTALFVALLGWTPVGEAGQSFLFPKNSVGKRELKKNAVGTKQIAKKAVGRGKLKNNVINSAKIQNNTIDGDDIFDESIDEFDIEDGSIDGDEILDDSLFGVDIFEDSLGTVPDADKVDGRDAACPAGTVELADGCMETSSRAAPAGGWSDAASACGEWGGRIPTSDELYYARTVPGIELTGAEMSSTLFGDAGSTEYMSVTDAGAIDSPGEGTPNAFRCVKDILN